MSDHPSSNLVRPADRLRALEAAAQPPLAYLRGNALAWHDLGSQARQIRDESLYRLKGYSTFGGYCWGEWRTPGEMVRRDIDIAAAFRVEDLPAQRVARGALWQAARAPAAARPVLLDLLLRGGLRVADVAAGRAAADAAARAGAGPEAVARAAEDAALAAALHRPAAPGRAAAPERGPVVVRSSGARSRRVRMGAGAPAPVSPAPARPGAAPAGGAGAAER